MDDTINNLRDALQHSPNNVPLKLHLAKTLFEAGRLEEAEVEYKQVLDLEPGNRKARFGLARVFYERREYSAAIVVLEQLVEQGNASQRTLVLYCRLLLKENSMATAQSIYRQVVEDDPDFRDAELDAHFRLGHGQGAEDEDDLIDEDGIEQLERPTINFDDVGGLEQVKEEIGLKIIHPMQHPELYEAYGKKVGGGILLYGPPGCGKTYLARATAGQVNARFLNIGISDVLDMWIGNSEKNLHEIFQTARENKPCVLFFDEVDALGASRTDMRQSAGRHLINQFLSELDGVESNNDGLLVLGATNAPWHLDPAFRRPGRFDRIIFVAPPDEPGRARILELLMQGKPAETINYKELARKSKEFSGADLQAVVDLCIEDKLKQSFKSGKPEPISTKDLLRAIGKHKPTTREWFNTAKNYALYANDSGLYDEILNYLKLKK